MVVRRLLSRRWILEAQLAGDEELVLGGSVGGEVSRSGGEQWGRQVDEWDRNAEKSLAEADGHVDSE